MASEETTERVGVRTYVPRYQKSEWKAAAAELDMSQAEFIRTMVQAGRRSFDFDSESENGSSNPADGNVGGSNPGNDALEDRVLDLLDTESHTSWDELLAGITDDVETRLEATLSDLQQANEIHYSGRHGGYTQSDGE